MPTYELIDRKTPADIQPGDCIIDNDRFWRVVENYKILGYPAGGKRLLIVTTPRGDNNGVKTIETEHRVDVYHQKD